MALGHSPGRRGCQSALHHWNIVDEADCPFLTFRRVEVDVKAGWNMVSVPGGLSDCENTVADVFGNQIIAIYFWNAVTKSYNAPTILEPNRGYWVAVTKDKTITITGTPVTEWICDIFQGWNMIGSAYGDTLDVSNLTTDADPDPLVRNAIYHWNPGSKSYESTSSIVPGEGYWAATTADCQLMLEPPT